MANEKGTFFSMVMPDSGLRTLSSFLQVSALSADEEVGISGTRPDIAAVGGLPDQSEKAKKLLFVTVIDAAIARAKRTKLPGQRQMTGVASVCIHEVLEFSQATKTCVASVSPISTYVSSEEGIELSVPMSLAICSISSKALESMYTWKESELLQDIVVRLSSAAHVDVPCADLEPVLEKLTSGDFMPAASQSVLNTLQKLEARGIVEGDLQASQPFRLTPYGREMVLTGIALQEGAKVCRRLPRGGDLLEDASLYQLMLELDAEGWEHEELSSKFSKRNARANPFLVNSEVVDKTWYTTEKQPACKFYLLALLVAKPDMPVPHLASSQTYRALLGLKPSTARRRSAEGSGAAGHPSLPDDFGEKKKTKPEKNKKELQKAPEVAPDHSSVESSEEISQQSESDLSDDDGEGSQDGGLVPGDGGDDDESSKNGSDVSDDNASGEGKSSGSDSDSDSDSSDGSEDSAASLVGGYYGSHTMIRRATGWQCTCNQPGHIKCNKSQSNTEQGGGSDGALRRLKAWALLATEAADKSAHKELWQRVEQQWKDGETPSMEELDGHMPALDRLQKKRRTK